MAVVPQDQSLHALQQVTDGENIRVDQPKAQDASRFGSRTHWSGPLGLKPSKEMQSLC